MAMPAQGTLLYGPDRGLQRHAISGRPRPDLRLSNPRARLVGLDGLLSVVGDRLVDNTPGVLGILSIDRAHVHHFGSRGRASRREREALSSASAAWQVEWLGLVNDRHVSKPLAELARHPLPVVASDALLDQVMQLAEIHHLRVGFLCTGPTVTEQQLISRRWPGVEVAFSWAVPPEAFADNREAEYLAGRVRETRAAVLILNLATPHQERFIAEHGSACGARICVGLGRPGHRLRSATEERPGQRLRAMATASRWRAQSLRLVRHLVPGASAHSVARKN